MKYGKQPAHRKSQVYVQPRKKVAIGKAKTMKGKKSY